MDQDTLQAAKTGDPGRTRKSGDFANEIIGIWRDTNDRCEPLKNNGLPVALGHSDVPKPPPENGNPGASVGDATGADTKVSDISGFYRTRLAAATALCLAISKCDPADAVKIMAAALNDLRVGMPIAPFDGVMDEALLWADFAMPEEIEAYAVACFKSMAPGRQRDFLAWAARSEAGSAA